MKHLTPSDFTEMPWLNGGGTTYEIARKSDKRGILWRVSTARVEADCLYSLFPKLQRISAVVEGNGIRVTNTKTTEESMIGPTDIARLSGDVLYQGALVDGGIRHLNLIFDPERAAAEMVFLEGGATALPARATHLVYCCSGEVTGANDAAAQSGEVLVAEDAVSIDLANGSRAIRISVSTLE